MQAPTTELERAEVFRRIDEVLAGDEFRVAETSPLLEWWQGVAERVREMLAQVFDLLDQALGGAEGGRAVVVVLTLAAVALVAWALWTVVRNRRREERAEPRSETGGGGAQGPPAADLALAAELAAAGRYGEAMHALYRGVLLWLDWSGAARYDDGKTGGEYARELSSALARPFKGLLRCFYPVAFGGRAADRRAFDAMRGAASDLGVPE